MLCIADAIGLGLFVALAVWAMAYATTEVRR